MIRIGLVGNPSRLHYLVEMLRETSHFLPTGIFWGEMKVASGQNQIDHPALLFKNDDELISSSDALIFVNCQNKDYSTVVKALRASRHVFMDPAEIIYPEMLQEIHKLGEEAGILYYIKHKLLHGEFQEKLAKFCGTPEFLDIYRYVPSAKENHNHEIQRIIRQELLFLFSLNDHEMKKYHLRTVPYCSFNPYIVNVRFEFSNSSAANLTINFFTQKNVRFSELFFNENILRINSGNNEIEFIDRQTGTLKVSRNSHLLRNEEKIDQELQRFLELLKIKHYPAGFKQSGLASHQYVWEIVRQIAEARVSQS